MRQRSIGSRSHRRRRPGSPSIAHILAVALKHLRGKIDYDPRLAVGLVPREFTQAEFRRVHEVVKAKKYDRGNFSKRFRRMLNDGRITPAPGTRLPAGAGRPAKLYTMRQDRRPARAGHQSSSIRWNTTRRKRLDEADRFKDLLVRVFRAGSPISDNPDPRAIRARARGRLRILHIKRRVNSHQYPAGLESGPRELRPGFILEARGKAVVARGGTAGDVPRGS